MRVISFIEARQGDVIREILEHCGLWRSPPATAPPARGPPAVGAKFPRPVAKAVAVTAVEWDPDYLEYKHREQCEQPDLPSEP